MIVSIIFEIYVFLISVYDNLCEAPQLMRIVPFCRMMVFLHIDEKGIKNLSVDLWVVSMGQWDQLVHLDPICIGIWTLAKVSISFNSFVDELFGDIEIGHVFLERLTLVIIAEVFFGYFLYLELFISFNFDAIQKVMIKCHLQRVEGPPGFETIVLKKSQNNDLIIIFQVSPFLFTENVEALAYFELYIVSEFISSHVKVIELQFEHDTSIESGSK